MISAHMDEVGYIVKAVSPEGFLFFDKIGGATEGCLPGRRVLVKGEKGVVPGIVGVRAGHLLTPEEMARPQTVRQSYVDICVSSREEATVLGIRTGAQIVPDSPCTEMRDPDYLCTRAADCRALCAILVESMLKLRAEDLCGEVFAVFNILEESTVSAAAAAVAYLKPEYSLFLDTIPCGDVPDCDYARELPIALGKGPVIVLSQQWANCCRCVASHPRLIEALRACAEETGAHWQEFAFNGAGYITDAVGAVFAGEGTAVATFAVPRRYSHSPVELLHLDDVVDAQKVVEAFLKREIDLDMM